MILHNVVLVVAQFENHIGLISNKDGVSMETTIKMLVYTNKYVCKVIFGEF